MNSLLVLFAALAITTTSFAAGNLVCHDNNGGPDHGYAIVFSKDLKSAQVSKITIAGYTDTVKVNCIKSTKKAPSYPDALVTLATCRQPNIADAGYNVVLRQGGIAGLTMASLSESTFFGSKAITQFICRTQK